MEPETTGSSTPNLTPSDKRKIRTFTNSLLVIVALAIFGGGTYYLGSTQQPAIPTEVLGTQIQQPTPEPVTPAYSATSSATPIPTLTNY